MQKFLDVIKEVFGFLVIVILKLLDGSKKEPKAQETSNVKNSGGIIKLIKLMFTNTSDVVKSNSLKSKEINLEEFKFKRKRKTWERVKQDFREWYHDLYKEFDEKYNTEHSEEIKEDKIIEKE